MHYKALIFDFFGVLCPEVSPVWFREQLGARGDALKGEIFRDADRGVIPQERVFAMLAEMSNMSAESIEKDWIARARIDTELLEYVRTFKGMYKLGLLTNSMASYFRTITRDFSLDTVFDAIVVSGELGYAKPDPAAYNEILKQLGVEARNCIFVDDNKVNVKAAEQVGMVAHHFTGALTLRAFLTEELGRR